MKLLSLIFCCVALLATQFLTADGIDCYICTGCKDPFKRNGHTVTSEHAYCTKTVAGGLAVRTGGSGSCKQVAIAGTGLFCCETNLCNGGVTKFGVGTTILSIAAGSLAFLLQAKLF